MYIALPEVRFMTYDKVKVYIDGNTGKLPIDATVYDGRYIKVDGEDTFQIQLLVEFLDKERKWVRLNNIEVIPESERQDM